MNVVDMVDFWGRSQGRHAAIIQPDLTLTYGQLIAAIDSAAEYFSRHDIGKSGPVAVAISNPAKMLVAVLGLFRAGVNVVPAHQAILEHLSSVGVTAMVGERNGIVLSTGTNILFDDGWLSRVPASKPIARRKNPDVNVILFTSGTTGRPKSIVQTQAAWEQRIMYSKNTTFANFERALIVPGLTTSFGFNRACEVLYSGKTACFALFGEPTLWLVNNYDIDFMFASIQQALSLAEIQEKITRYNLKSLKAVRVGGSLITQEGVERIKRNLCRKVIVAYASSEAGMIAIANHDMIANIPNAVGFVSPEVDVEIVDQNGLPLPVGKEGFVRLRTPPFAAIHAAANPGQTRDATKVWYHPGDLGWLTEDSVLCIAGRSGDVINRGGVKLSSASLEEFLCSCEGVRDAGVCSVMGESGFEEAWVAVVFDSAIDLAAFRKTIETSDRFGRNIDKLFVVEAIPRAEAGKIQRNILKEMLQAINEETRVDP